MRPAPSLPRWLGPALAAAALLVAVCLSPSLHRHRFERMTNDEAMYVWKVERLATSPTAWREPAVWVRHPPAVPAAVAPLARWLPLPAAVSVANRAIGLAALLTLGAFAWRLASPGSAAPVAGLAAPTLLLLDETVRTYAAHFLLELPLLLVLCAAAWVWMQPGRGRWLALPIAALAPAVKSYGLLVLAVFPVAALYERARGRERLALWLAGGLAVVLVLGVGSQGWLGHRIYWLQAFDPLEAARTKLYTLFASFQWLAPGARVRWVMLAAVALVGLLLPFVRIPEPRRRDLVVCMLAVPAGGLLVSSVITSRAFLLVMAPLYALLALGLAGLVGRSPRRWRPGVAAAGVALGCLLLQRAEARTDPAVPCELAGQWETAAWLSEHAREPDVRIFSNAAHQIRLYAGLAFERDGGTLYGRNEWTSLPSWFTDFVRASEEKPSYLALAWNEDIQPDWLAYDRTSGERILALGYVPVAAIWLPWNGTCVDEDPEAGRRRAGFHAALGLTSTRGRDAEREYLAGIVLARPAPSQVSQGTPRSGRYPAHGGTPESDPGLGR